MDEKTAELRDIFLSVSGEETVTESQEESRGSLAGERPVDEQLSAVISRMKDRYDFRTSLDTEVLVTVVRAFYDGDEDATIASTIDEEPDTVQRARFDLHLLREVDFAASNATDSVRDHLQAGLTPEAAANAIDTDTDRSTVLTLAHALKTKEEIRKVGDRYREEFEEIIEDRDLQSHLAASLRDDGLADATDGMETNVSF